MRRYSKNNLLADKYCTKPSEHIANLESVLFTNNATIATNGHMLIQIEAPKEYEPSDINTDTEASIHVSDLPKINKNQEMVIDKIDTEKKEAHIRIMEWTADKTMGFKNGNKADIIPLSDGFPDISRLLKKCTEKPKYRVAFDPKYLKTIADTFDKAGCRSVMLSIFEEEEETVKIPVGVDDYNIDLDPSQRQTPALFNSPSSDTNKGIKVLLMPVRQDYDQ